MSVSSPGFEPVDIPKADPHVRAARYRATSKGRATDDRRNERKAERRLEAYLKRRFVSWDGEGVNTPDGSHLYVLLANLDGDAMVSESGLATLDVFDMFYRADPSAVHVGYGLSYDVNMILRDVPEDNLKQIYEDGSTFWDRYWIEWRGGKSLRIKRRGAEKAFTLYDVLPFFQTSFVKACDEYLGKDWPDREQIIREKRNRSAFTFARVDAITRYNQSELVTLARLCDELKARLFKVDIKVNRWDGPGAIATALYTRHRTKDSLGTVPSEVGEYGRYAYAGGRFEIIRKGHSTTGAYQYDIRSAYPSAIRNLPCLAHGKWRHVVNPTRVAPFGVYRISVDSMVMESITQPQPLWKRNPDGTVYFSVNPEGVYWSPEAQIATEFGIPIIDGWEYATKCECAPFAFVEPMYNKRAALKKAGDGAHVGLKLGLNSLYGKLAQQIGWDAGPPLRIPPYHCLEWAGFITSHCRAQVFRAAMLAPDDIIAFETDAVFSRVPLPLRLGTRLGEWEATEYASLTYLKSGMYFGTLTNGKEVEKSRGINQGTLLREDVIEALARERWFDAPGFRKDDLVLNAEQTRFIGLGLAMSQGMDKWTRWVTSPRLIKVTLAGKRIDLLDNRDSRKEIGDGWYETMPGIKHRQRESYPYEVEWINPQPDIRHPETGERLSDVRKRQAWEGVSEYEG
jgi:hypothetical protein